MTTSLDALETSSTLSIPDTYRDHSTANCLEEIQATREVYYCDDSVAGLRKLYNFDTCRDRAWFVRHDETGQVRVATKSCKLRWCPLCAKKRQWFLSQQFLPWAESVSRLKFLTLTLKHSESPLQQQISDLYGFWQRFRKLKYLRENMFGGVWFFQIKKSSADGLWHPHLHCLIEANYMPQETLSKLWQRTTLTSKVVDIEGVDDIEKVAEYVGRYSARPSALKDLSLGERITVVEALHGRRLLGTWGSARQVSLKVEKPEDANQWKHVGFWSTVVGRYRQDDNARTIFNAWKNDKPLEPDINMHHIETYLRNKGPGVKKDPPENRQLFLQFKGCMTWN